MTDKEELCKVLNIDPDKVDEVTTLLIAAGMLKRVEKERDAAISQLRHLAQQTDRECEYCGHPAESVNCVNCGRKAVNWIWRGATNE